LTILTKSDCILKYTIDAIMDLIPVHIDSVLDDENLSLSTVEQIIRAENIQYQQYQRMVRVIEQFVFNGDDEIDTEFINAWRDHRLQLLLSGETPSTNTFNVDQELEIQNSFFEDWITDTMEYTLIPEFEDFDDSLINAMDDVQQVPDSIESDDGSVIDHFLSTISENFFSEVSEILTPDNIFDFFEELEHNVALLNGDDDVFHVDVSDQVESYQII